MTRHEARDQAFELVFAMSFQPELDMKELYTDAVESHGLKQDDYTAAAAAACAEHTGEIDGIIGSFSDKWKPDRLSRATLAVLRLAIAEMEYLGEPHGAIINEAVELAKKYCGDDEPSFVNGVLGAYSRSKEKPE